MDDKMPDYIWAWKWNDWEWDDHDPRDTTIRDDMDVAEYIRADLAHPAPSAMPDYEILSPVAAFFHGDANKVRLWFETANPMLGGMAPKDCKRDVLAKFINEAVDFNSYTPSAEAVPVAWWFWNASSNSWYLENDYTQAKAKIDRGYEYCPIYTPPQPSGDWIEKVREALDVACVTINTGGKVTRDTEVYKMMKEVLSLLPQKETGR